MLDVGFGALEIALLPVEQGQRDADLHAGLEAHVLARCKGLRVVAELRAHEEVRDALGAHAGERRPGALDIHAGEPHVGALAEHAGDDGLAVDDRYVAFEIAVQRRERQQGVADACGEDAPDPPLVALGLDQLEIGSLRLHLDVEHVRPVRLSHVEQLPGHAHRLAHERRQLTAQLDQPRGAQRLVVERPHRREHAEPLHLCRRLRLLATARGQVAAELELPRRHDRDLEPEEVLEAPRLTGVDLLGLVADQGVRIEAGLGLTAFGGPDRGARLRQRGILLERHPLEVLEAERRARPGHGLRRGRPRYERGAGERAHSDQEKWARAPRPSAHGRAPSPGVRSPCGRPCGRTACARTR